MPQAELLDRLKNFPTKPGIYLMRDRGKKVVYVGKAKNLRSRVRSYFRGGDGRVAIKFLVEKVADIEVIVTENERQALILEADLIKKHKPRYNIRLKDDKAHYLVRIDLSHEWPRLDLVRQVADDGARYFGPFAFAYELRAVLDIIRQTIPLRTCSDRVMYNRVRPCLEYQMKRCLGPCCLDVNRAEYLHLVDQAIAVLNGKNSEVIEELVQQMEGASEQLRFEEAAELRDRLDVLQRTVQERSLFAFNVGAKDAIGIHREGTDIELSILMVRHGRLFGAKNFGFEDVEVPTEEVLASALNQYYSSSRDIPEEIIIPMMIEECEAQEEYFSELRGGKVVMKTVQRGESARLLELAQENARETFAARFSPSVKSGDSILTSLANELHLDEIPRTVECVDISHFQGGSTVGAVVFAQDGQFDKSRYRHFHLTQEGKPDDFASMREIVTRHLSRCVEENTVADLMIIDGGRAQLNQALEVRKALGLSRPFLAGLAKKKNIRPAGRDYYSRGRRPFKPERIFVEEGAAPLVLRESGAALRFLERIRDEAHRFAVSFHRSTRAKRVFQTSLDRIPGLGPKRKRELLKEFGSIQNIAAASVDELRERAGVPEKIGERVLKSLRSEKEPRLD